jgi:hypothetical protein
MMSCVTQQSTQFNTNSISSINYPIMYHNSNLNSFFGVFSDYSIPIQASANSNPQQQFHSYRSNGFGNVYGNISNCSICNKQVLPIDDFERKRRGLPQTTLPNYIIYNNYNLSSGEYGIFADYVQPLFWANMPLDRTVVQYISTGRL